MVKRRSLKPESASYAMIQGAAGSVADVTRKAHGSAAGVPARGEAPLAPSLSFPRRLKLGSRHRRELLPSSTTMNFSSSSASCKQGAKTWADQRRCLSK